ncbi:helix-turn-helix domain-containing protein [Rhodoferax sp. UBA5149]|uniref:helix-turn-helix domain-containing protein n=1 Tax=Rhodoferax sp. UBA5149 TaxID=1947379 RepID=UPI0025F47555|nr:helix-turn-helix domain-containing protein [Rhodoferax sp. UBA5149]
MSESVLPSSDNLVLAQDSIAQISGGAMLRNAREAEGLHIAALAVSLKVPVKKLEALEADRFDLLPDTVFVRALAASVCRTLKIDPAPILERLPHTTAPRLKTDESGINTPFRVSGDGSGFSFWNQLSKPFALAVLVLLLGVVVLIFFPFTQLTKIAGVAKSDTDAVVFPLPTPTQTPLANENPASAEATARPQSSILAPSGLAMNPASVASAASLQGVASAAFPAVVPGSEATTGVVVFKARGASWVEVVDASGAVQLRKTMTGGDVVGASGVLPLSVVVGRADTTEVQVRGKPFDLTRIAKDNVARFEVK